MSGSGRTFLLSYCYPPMNVPRAIQVGRLVGHLDPPPTALWVGDEPGGDPTIPVPPLPPAGLHRERLRGRGVGRALLGRLAVPDAYLSWAIRTGRRLVAGASPGPGDLLVTFGQPMSDHVAGLLVQRRTGVRWIAHFSDPWSQNPFARRGRAQVALNRRLERAVLTRADRVVFTSETARDAVLGAHPGIDARPAVLPHSYDDLDYPAPPAIAGRRVARVVGSFYGIRTPEPLVAALRSLAAEAPGALEGWDVELVGPITPELRASLDERLVRSRPPVPFATSLELMREADLLLVVDAPGPTSVFLPSKLVEYVGAGRPIAALSPPGPAAELVRALGGHVADPADPAAGGRALGAALAEAATAGFPWGDPTVRDGLRAETVAARFHAICREVLDA